MHRRFCFAFGTCSANGALVRHRLEQVALPAHLVKATEQRYYYLFQCSLALINPRTETLDLARLYCRQITIQTP
jgi:hypothetical protein